MRTRIKQDAWWRYAAATAVASLLQDYALLGSSCRFLLCEAGDRHDGHAVGVYQRNRHYQVSAGRKYPHMKEAIDVKWDFGF
ncbi:hypothetical protein BJX65DRAFT_261541 [Aspergillus insuetus]